MCFEGTFRVGFLLFAIAKPQIVRICDGCHDVRKQGFWVGSFGRLRQWIPDPVRDGDVQPNRVPGRSTARGVGI